MSDLALVRAQIKSWERDFASRHGRDPSVQDIRDQPDIAEKYKLYKKLSKPAPSHSSTPPRARRTAEPVPPLPGFNPFSPVKKSAKHNHSLRPSASQAPRTSPHPNPFASPAKNKPKPCPRTQTPSPDPFPSVAHPSANASSSRGQSVSTTAVSRARKRLRGEPVSPSPNKPKRQRIRSQAPPPIPQLGQDSSNSEHETDQELPHCDFTSVFVADSPIKAPAGGKSFKLLFDDALPALSIAKRPAGSSIPQIDSGPDAHFSQSASANPSVPTSLKPRHHLKSKGGPGSRVQGKLSAQIFPTRDNLPAPSHKAAFTSVVSQVLQPGTSMKRTLDSSDPVPVQSQYLLIPPSPPPQDSISRDTGKGKVKTAAGRKRLRVEDEESDEGVESPDGIILKVATANLDWAKHRHADDLEWDPLLHLRTCNHDSAAKEQIDANRHTPGTFSVDLPDKFHRVLAISSSRSQNSTEERVVRGLLYGDRVGHYDPSRGGDIWDAGEIDEGALGDAETEDDWEGEPVPWEAGEL